MRRNRRREREGFRVPAPAATRMVAAAALLGTLLLVAAAGSSAATPQTAIRAVIWPNQLVTIAPKSVKHGKVVLIVKNRDATVQQLELNGQATPLIQPGGSVKVTLSLPKRGVYTFALPDAQQSYANDYQHAGTRIRVT